MQDYYHSYLPLAYETGRFGEYEVTVDSVATRGDIVVRELRMASIKVCNFFILFFVCLFSFYVEFLFILLKPDEF